MIFNICVFLCLLNTIIQLRKNVSEITNLQRIFFLLLLQKIQVILMKINCLLWKLEWSIFVRMRWNMDSNCLCLLCPPGPNSARCRAILPHEARAWCGQSPGHQGMKPGKSTGPGRNFGWLVPVLVCRFVAHCAVDTRHSRACPCAPPRQDSCTDRRQIPQAAEGCSCFGDRSGGKERERISALALFSPAAFL